MGVLLDVAVAVPVAAVVGAGSSVVWLRARLDRSLRLVPDRGLRLVPGRRPDVPWRWRWSPGRTAVLHRRLQRSCQVVLSATGGTSAYRLGRAGRLRRHRAEDPSVLRAAGRDLLTRAVQLDDRLVAADRGGATWRRLHLPALAAEISSVEASCLRLGRLAGALDAHLDAATGRDGPGETDTLLDAVEAAIADLRRPPRPTSSSAT